MEFKFARIATITITLLLIQSSLVYSMTTISNKSKIVSSMLLILSETIFFYERFVEMEYLWWMVI